MKNCCQNTRLCPQCYCRQLIHVYNSLTKGQPPDALYMCAYSTRALELDHLYDPKWLKSEIKKERHNVRRYLKENYGITYALSVARIGLVNMSLKQLPPQDPDLRLAVIAPWKGQPHEILLGRNYKPQVLKFGTADQLAEIAYEPLHFISDFYIRGNINRVKKIQELTKHTNPLIGWGGLQIRNTFGVKRTTLHEVYSIA